MTITPSTPSLLANDHGLYLATVADALDAVGSGLPGCVFTQADFHPGLFDLRNGLAGEVFQKFTNYNFQAAFVLPSDHGYGDRVTELIREHKRSSSVRFFESIEDAAAWLK